MPYKFSVPRPFKDSEEEYLEFPDDVPMEEAVGIADKYYTKQFFNEGLHMAIGGLVKDKISAEDFFTGLGDKAADAMETLNLAVTGKNKYTDPASEFYNPEYNKTQEDAVTEAISLVGLGGRASSVEGGAGTMGTFVGRQAIGKSKAEAFETIEKSGTLSKEQMWEKFGMYRGPDGLLRKEVSDKVADIKTSALDKLFKDPPVNGARTGHFKLDEVLDHPELMEHYPQLKNVKVQFKIQPGEYSGSFDANNNWLTITAPNKGQARSVLLHEVQHKIQSLEGFARGGNPGMADQYLREASKLRTDTVSKMNTYLEGHLTPDKEMKIQDIIQDTMDKGNPDAYWDAVAKEFKDHSEFIEEYKKLKQVNKNYRYLSTVKDQQSEFEFYNDLFGEMEARNVQIRSTWSDAKLKSEPPWETQDVPYLGKKNLRGQDPKRSKFLEMNEQEEGAYKTFESYKSKWKDAKTPQQMDASVKEWNLVKRQLVKAKTEEVVKRYPDKYKNMNRADLIDKISSVIEQKMEHVHEYRTAKNKP
jgi:hypothetical protein